MATQLSAIGRLGTGFNVDENGVVSVSGGGGGELSNLIINGDFSVAQRGTSFTSATWRANSDDSYLLDRWLLLSDGNDIVDVTQISGAFSRSRYALQAEVETANKKFGFCQIIEANSCIPLRGKKISVSFAAKTVTDKLIENVRVAVLEWTGTADEVTSDVVSAWENEGVTPTFATNWAALNTPANLALTTSEQTFKVENLTVGASCNNLAVFVWVDDTDCAVDDVLQLGEVQVVRGSVAPEFVARDDLISCRQRYWSPAFGAMSNADLGATISDYGVALGQLDALNCKFTFISASHTNGSGGAYTVIFPSTMKTIPTIIFFGNSNAAGKWYRHSDASITWNTPNVTNLSNSGFLISSSVGTASYGIYMCGGFAAEAEL